MHTVPASWNDLPRTRDVVVREGYALEFKRQVDPKNRAELAKDVALLANTFGGLLLVGADEKTDGVEYCGLHAELAKEVANAYVEAVRDFCSPRPIHHTSEVVNPTDPDVVVVGVAVEPFPDQPVGAAYPDKERRPTDAWRFPIRVNRHTIYLRAEQLMMWFNPKTRRTAIALSEIPENSKVEFCCGAGAGERRKPWSWQAVLKSWDLLANYIELAPISGHPRIEPFRAPLEDVSSVWMSGDGTWSIRLCGSIGGGRTSGLLRYHAGE